MTTNGTEHAAGAAQGADVVHPDLTLDEVLSAATDDQFAGFCTSCGARTDGIEPDARQCTCDECGAHQVFGAEQMIIEHLFH